MGVGNIAHLIASAKAAISKRETIPRIQNLEIINDCMKTLAATIEGYQGGLLAAAPLGRDSAILGQAIKYAIRDAKATPAPPTEGQAEAEAREIIEYFTSVLLLSSRKVGEAVQSKKGLFVAANLQGTMIEEMRIMRGLSATLSKALLEKAPESMRPGAEKLDVEVDNEFATVIEACS